MKSADAIFQMHTKYFLLFKKKNLFTNLYFILIFVLYLYVIYTFLFQVTSFHKKILKPVQKILNHAEFYPWTKHQILPGHTCQTMDKLILTVQETGVSRHHGARLRRAPHISQHYRIGQFERGPQLNHYYAERS